MDVERGTLFEIGPGVWALALKVIGHGLRPLEVVVTPGAQTDAKPGFAEVAIPGGVLAAWRTMTVLQDELVKYPRIGLITDEAVFDAIYNDRLGMINPPNTVEFVRHEWHDRMERYSEVLYRAGS